MTTRDPLTNTQKMASDHQLRLRKKLSLQQGEVSTLSFWISQIFMIIATVLGVYLAGQQGLAQAVNFEQIQSDKNNYYLRKSLQFELEDNVKLVQAYIDALGDTCSRPAAQCFQLELEQFIWESMKFSTATLETPPELLHEARSFYRKVLSIHNNVIQEVYGRAYAAGLMRQQTEHMQHVVLPMFTQDLSELKQLLRANKVEVE
ncbi:hypothetical protein Q3O60_15795 [Alkalimonas collagenimarina]|uniref:DUF4142 domain-containing protein n=1 Tax=Alkalimonas collagenimarina TaxID=400390 RepID=A0ABT9H2X1_9GAMM|nr:hypothetical protein [Alkalimonas collagenimarina]MDP4537649.1 hypothetical protein [Alkalimonas collagenimarina]